MGDPCYRGQKGAGALQLAIPIEAEPGRWHVFVRPGEGSDANRTAELALVHEAGFAVVAAEPAGSIGVDSGTAGAFDAKCPKRKDNDDLYDEGVVAGLGAVAYTGLGDGLYPVFVGRGGSGRVAKIRLFFLGPEPPGLDATIAREANAVRKYSPKEHFAVGDAIEHPKFGAGTVVRTTGEDKIEVSFADGDRVLVHARSSTRRGGMQVQ